jgi:NADH dehydrogenase
VVIVGGGFAGLAAARALRRSPVEVVLVDKQNHHLFQPLLYQVATAALSPGNIAAPIRGILRRQSNVSVAMVAATRVDVAKKTVWLEEEPYLYDYLVLATGSETNYFGNEEWSEHAPGLKTIEEATEVRARFLLALEQAEVERDPKAQKATLTVAIVGAGPTGVEMSAALAEIVKSIRRDFRHVDTRGARIVLIDAMDRVLTTYDPKLSAKAQRDLEELGVEVLLSSKVVQVDEAGLAVETPGGRLRIDADNVIWAAGVKASSLGATLGAELDRSGRVSVGDDLSIPGHPNVFVVGDLAHRIDPISGESVPGVAQGALQMGRFAGETIAKEIQAKSTKRSVPSRRVFVFNDKGSMAIIGKNRAVAEIGRLRFAGIPAFLIWALIHIWSLIGFRRKLVVFTEWVWQYFFHSRGVRLITGEDRLPRSVEPPPDPRSR